MIPLAMPDLSGNERKYLNECIDSTYVSSVGLFVNRLESLIAEISGIQYGVAVSSGTTGLHTALTAYGVGRDDIVIIPSFTFIATANAISNCGATPWLMDVKADSWCIDADQLEDELKRKIEVKGGVVIHKASGRRVAAIMPVYTLGNIPDMDRICIIAEKYSLPIIADAAAAIGAEYKDRKCGELADCTVFSFNGNKTVTSGGGGAVVGNDEQMMKRIKHLSTTARVSSEYDFDMVGFNYRMTNIQAAVGCAQLERVEKLVEKKRWIRSRYRELLDGIQGISFFPVPENVNYSCWFSGVVIEEADHEKFKDICSKLKDQGIEARSFWKPIHMQKPYEKAIKADSLKTTDALWSRILALPCSTNITNSEIETVSESLKKVLMNEY